MFKKVTKLFQYQNLIFETVENVAVIKLNRPKALNALNKALCTEIGQVIKEIESNKDLRVIVITGEGQKAFVSGADIKEMSTQTFMDVYKNQLFGELTPLKEAKKPVIAAVNGFALGGGCELAMMCDIIIASEKAKFGQPEIKLGTIPGLFDEILKFRNWWNTTSYKINWKSESNGMDFNWTNLYSKRSFRSWISK